MKILVTGGTQFVSWYVTRRLLEEGNEVTTLNRGNIKGIHRGKVVKNPVGSMTFSLFIKVV